MDAVKLISEQSRMCKAMKDCISCPYDESCICHADSTWSIEKVEKAVKIVEKWAKEHPQETRWTLLKKQYPKIIDSNKYWICVRQLGYECEDCGKISCTDCWDVPIEEKEQE